MAQLRRCLCCGKEYRFCTSCPNGKKEGISAEFDTHECKDLFNVISGYNMGIFSKDKVQEVLNKHNISNYTKYNNSITNKLNELFSKEEVKSKQIVEVVKEAPIEENVIEEDVKEKEVIENIYSKPSYSYKRNNKKKNRNVDIDLSENE